MGKRAFTIFLLFLLVSVSSFAGNEEKKKALRITGYVGGGVAKRCFIDYSRGGGTTAWEGDFSLGLTVEKEISRMWSIVVSTGYSSKVIDYSDLESSATGRFFNSGLVTVPSYPTSNPDIEPDFTISVPKEFSIVVDIGGRFYPYRTADDKLALFLHFSLLGFYYDWARFHYQLVTGPEGELCIKPIFPPYSLTSFWGGGQVFDQG